MTVTLFGQMVCGMLCQPSAKVSDPVLSARSYQDIAGLQILAVTLRSLESSDGGLTPSLMVKFMGKDVYRLGDLWWFTWFFTKGFPQFMKKPLAFAARRSLWITFAHRKHRSPLSIWYSTSEVASHKIMDYNPLMDNSRQMVNNMGYMTH